jgi:hypothetical protein
VAVSWRVCSAAVAVLALSACSAVISSTTGRLSGDLAAAVLNSNDPETVRQGAPAYLLLIDGLIEGDPESEQLLLTGARLYSSYAGVFVEDKDRQRLLSEKARDYGWRALCRSNRRTCGMWSKPYDEFASVVTTLGREDLPALYGAAAAWASWVQANRDDWVAVADKARVEAMMRRVVALEETYERGAPYLYLGVLATLLPEALGGRPEEGRQHFERAIALAENRDFMAKVLLARDYARLVFDQELHDRLCQEVLDEDPVESGLTLGNVLAQREAERLLAESQEYFGE